MYVFYCIFAQFMQFPVLDFGLVHSGSEPFNCKFALAETYILGHWLLSLAWEFTIKISVVI